MIFNVLALVMIYTFSRMYSRAIISIVLAINLCDAIGLSKPVDLTWPFENSTIYWTGVREFQLKNIVAEVTEGNFWVAMNEFCAGEHGGTHIDAPYHFKKDGRKVGEIPLERLITPGVVIDISNEVEEDGSPANLQVKHLIEWQKHFGAFEYNTVIIVKFGWSKYYPDKKSYLGLDDKNGLHFPGVSKEASEWIVKTGNVVGVGVDVASIDPGTSTTSDSHQILNGNDIYLIENIKLVEKLPPRGFTLLVMPMHIAEGTGAPVRLVAVPNYIH